ncbi:MAG: ADP-forming succinate--CoA ligase subunit beta [Anaerolineaceae bacterium]|nr:ADP-forming succinate--CoA ligase subunit beta [Anaerolineaceae bacterium]
MNLHEYQSKARFAEFGIPVLPGKAASTPQQVYEIARELGGKVVIKAQIPTPDRGKIGGILFAENSEQAETLANSLLGSVINGLIVRKVLVNPTVEIRQEMYLGITNDRATCKPMLVASREGGRNIIEVARENPELIVRDAINPCIGLRDYQIRGIASSIDLANEHWKHFLKITHDLYACYATSDAILAEINPLAITQDNRLLALDSKLVIDDNALYRHTDLAEMYDSDGESGQEARARAAGVSYVELEGQIGCIANGAGLAMTTIDIIHLYGDGAVKPASFLDIGGGAQSATVATALEIMLEDPQVQVVLLNIFGGITRCDEVSRGILQTLGKIQTKIPLIVRLAGTNATSALQMIDDAGHPNVTSAATLTEAARKAITAVQETN